MNNQIQKDLQGQNSVHVPANQMVQRYAKLFPDFANWLVPTFEPVNIHVKVAIASIRNIVNMAKIYC